MFVELSSVPDESKSIFEKSSSLTKSPKFDGDSLNCFRGGSSSEFMLSLDCPFDIDFSESEEF